MCTKDIFIPVAPNLAFSGASPARLSLDGAMSMMIGTVEVMACPCSWMENFFYCGLALWGRGAPPQDSGHASPLTTSNGLFHRLILWTKSPMSRDRGQLPSAVPVLEEVCRTQRRMGVLSMSQGLFIFLTPILSFLF